MRENARLQDPRWYQLIVLSLLLVYGTAALAFGIRWQKAVITAMTDHIRAKIPWQNGRVPDDRPIVPWWKRIWQ